MSNLIIRKWSAFWFSGAICISIFCLTITFFVPEINEYNGLFSNFLLRFNLAWENNFGAWWSGILLLLASVHAFDGFFVYKNKQPSISYGWAIISAILFILSADEIGSIHERVDRLLSFGTWLSLLPFALILIGALIFGVLSLWQVSELRKKVIWIVIAFSLLMSVALQEYLEHNSQWWGEFSSLRVVVEEGTELLAILILLKVSMSNTHGIFKQRETKGRPVFQVLTSFRMPLLVIGAMLAPALAWITANLPDMHRGNPANWLAAAGFFFAGLVIGRQFFKSGKSIGWLSLVLIVICWIMSAVAVFPVNITNPAVILQKKFLVLYLSSLAIFVIWMFHAKLNKLNKTFFVPSIAVIAISTAMSALYLIEIDTSLFFIFLLFPLVSLLIYYVNAYIDASATYTHYT